MAVTLYRSTDAGAPELVNVTGSAIDVLTACLVTGYGAKSGAGFTKHASSTATVAAFQSGEATSTGHWLVVTDTATTVIAEVFGAETLTDITTFERQFPIPTQTRQTNIKSKSLNASPVPWFLITDGFIFYFGAHQSNDQRVYIWCFGDILAFKVADAFHSILIAHGGGGSHGLGSHTIGANFGASIAAFMPRSYTQVGTSISVGLASNMFGATVSASSNFIYPSEIDSGLLVSPVFITEAPPISSVRGILPGVYYTPQNVYGSVVNYTEFSGIVGLTGKTLMYMNATYGTAGECGVFYDLTGPWR